MYSHGSRKLLIPPEFDDDPTILPHKFSAASPPTIPVIHISPPPSNSDPHNTHYTTATTTTATNGYNNYKLTSPFDSSMALTVLVLLTAFFFMAFFSLYIRRFADESSVDPSTFLRRRQRREDNTNSTSSNTYKGVDPHTVRSLPVYSYTTTTTTAVVSSSSTPPPQPSSSSADCAICLSEFEYGEWLKSIPFCGHVFHVGCIDVWLSSHRTCPLCRTEKIFPRPSPVVTPDREEEEVDDSSSVCRLEMREAESTMDGSDTWREVVEVTIGEMVRMQQSSGVRRSSSSSTSSWSWDVSVGPVRNDDNDVRRGGLHRSFSF